MYNWFNELPEAQLIAIRDGFLPGFGQIHDLQPFEAEAEAVAIANEALFPGGLIPRIISGISADPIAPVGGEVVTLRAGVEQMLYNNPVRNDRGYFNLESPGLGQAIVLPATNRFNGDPYFWCEFDHDQDSICDPEDGARTDKYTFRGDDTCEATWTIPNGAIGSTISYYFEIRDFEGRVVGRSPSGSFTVLNRSAVVWVDFDYAGEEDGSSDFPYNTLAEGLSVLASGGSLRFHPGSSGVISTPPISVRSFWEAFGGTVTIGQ